MVTVLTRSYKKIENIIIQQSIRRGHGIDTQLQKIENTIIQQCNVVVTVLTLSYKRSKIQYFIGLTKQIKTCFLKNIAHEQSHGYTRLQICTLMANVPLHLFYNKSLEFNELSFENN